MSRRRSAQVRRGRVSVPRSTTSDDFLKKVVIALGIFLLLFTITILIIFQSTGSEPSTLIASVFAACLGEGSICGFIKNRKDKKPKETENTEDIAG